MIGKAEVNGRTPDSANSVTPYALSKETTAKYIR
jgi:hypothetical protein